jgi:thioredoxin-related protein
MKYYVIAFLVVSLVVLGTFYYKLAKTPALDRFPIENPVGKIESGEPPLYIFIFFSRNNCPVCLDVIQELNKLQPPLVVYGIVPGKELENEKDLRNATGATFKLIPFKNIYKRFRPHYFPTTFGVSGKGRVLFVLPGVPDEKDYIKNFLATFYGRSMELLISEFL